MMLYRLTNEKEWLDVALDAAWYLSTWQYCATKHFPSDTMLFETGYNTFGGTIVSTVHQGIDSFANTYVPELYQLYLITGEKRWYERAKAIWENGYQHVSDGTLAIGGAIRPMGGQDEYYESTRQSLSGKQKAGEASGWLVAWPGAFRLDVVQRMKLLDDTGIF